MVYLRVELPDAVSRVGLGAGRPLLTVNPRATLKYLLDQRRPLYEEVATHHGAPPTARTPDEIAAEVARRSLKTPDQACPASRARPLPAAAVRASRRAQHQPVALVGDRETVRASGERRAQTGSTGRTSSSRPLVSGNVLARHDRQVGCVDAVGRAAVRGGPIGCGVLRVPAVQRAVVEAGQRSGRPAGSRRRAVRRRSPLTPAGLSRSLDVDFREAPSGSGPLATYTDRRDPVAQAQRGRAHRQAAAAVADHVQSRSVDLGRRTLSRDGRVAAMAGPTPVPTAVGHAGQHRGRQSRPARTQVRAAATATPGPTPTSPGPGARQPDGAANARPDRSVAVCWRPDPRAGRAAAQYPPADRLGAMTTRIDVGGERPYQVLVGRDLLDALPPLVAGAAQVAVLYAAPLRAGGRAGRRRRRGSPAAADRGARRRGGQDPRGRRPLLGRAGRRPTSPVPTRSSASAAAR